VLNVKKYGLDIILFFPQKHPVTLLDDPEKNFNLNSDDRLAAALAPGTDLLFNVSPSTKSTSLSS
jgi:hypothetical protein